MYKKVTRVVKCYYKNIETNSDSKYIKHKDLKITISNFSKKIIRSQFTIPYEHSSNFNMINKEGIIAKLSKDAYMNYEDSSRTTSIKYKKTYNKYLFDVMARVEIDRKNHIELYGNDKEFNEVKSYLIHLNLTEEDLKKCVDEFFKIYDQIILEKKADVAYEKEMCAKHFEKTMEAYYNSPKLLKGIRLLFVIWEIIWYIVFIIQVDFIDILFPTLWECITYVFYALFAYLLRCHLIKMLDKLIFLLKLSSSVIIAMYLIFFFSITFSIVNLIIILI